MMETFADGKVRSWASILDDVTRAQAAETASLSIISAPIALMPDAHLGAGATIGTVLVTENALIPMAVGVDIGCGLAARKLQLKLDDLRDTGASAWVREMQRTVPAGLGNWHGKACQAALDWMDENPPSSRLENVPRAAEQLGTLGSGNHFVELSVDEDGYIWLLLHSGSRGAGNKLAQIHRKVANTFTGAVAPTGTSPGFRRRRPNSTRTSTTSSGHSRTRWRTGDSYSPARTAPSRPSSVSTSSSRTRSTATTTTPRSSPSRSWARRCTSPARVRSAPVAATAVSSQVRWAGVVRRHRARQPRVLRELLARRRSRDVADARAEGDSARRVRGSHGGRRVAGP
jgi:hypothetical protein